MWPISKYLAGVLLFKRIQNLAQFSIVTLIFVNVPNISHRDNPKINGGEL